MDTYRKIDDNRVQTLHLVEHGFPLCKTDAFDLEPLPRNWRDEADRLINGEDIGWDVSVQCEACTLEWQHRQVPITQLALPLLAGV